MPRECILFHVGQAGVQIGNPLWELLCLEHGIAPNGQMPFPPCSRDSTLTESIFTEHSSGTFTPRAFFLDMEPNCIDTIRNGCYRHLFHPDAFIVGKEDTANNFARGYYTMAREYKGVTMERIRNVAEKCDGLQGFNVFRSVGGGCGSGFGSFLLDKLTSYFGRKTRISYDIIPSPQIRSEPVEPYNAVFANHAGEGSVDVSYIFDNESLEDICSRRLGLMNPHFDNYNRLMAQVISGMTAALRFSGASLREQANLIPFPRLRYPMVSYVPFLTSDMSAYEELAMPTLIANLFERKNQLIRCDTRLGKYMAMSLTFRGDFSPKEISTVKHLLQGTEKSPGKIRFVDWAPPGFKVNLCERPPYGVPGTDLASPPRAIVATLNTTAIAQPWEGLRRKFKLMWKKRAFMQWYIAEGMEEVEFAEAHENMSNLQNDYADLEREGQCKKNSLDLTVHGRPVTIPVLPTKIGPDGKNPNYTCL